MTPTVICPHCQSPCAAGAAFCTNCGKAVSTGMGGPSIVSGSAIASTEAGRALQTDELVKNMKKAFGALLAVGILQAVFTVAIIFLVSSQANSLQNTPFAAVQEIPVTAVAIEGFGIAAVFLGLAFWARKSPFPASIIGLVVFITVHAWAALQNPANLVQGILMKIIIIVILGRAISAGAKHRAIIKSQPAGF